MPDETLTPSQGAAIAVEMKAMYQAAAEERRAAGLKQFNDAARSDQSIGTEGPKGDVDAIVGGMVGVGEANVRRAGRRGHG